MQRRFRFRPNSDHLEARQMLSISHPALPSLPAVPSVTDLRAASRPVKPDLQSLESAATDDLGDAFSFTVSNDDGQGDSVTVTVSFTPDGAGGFVYDETINYTWTSSTGGGQDMLHVNVSLSGDTATFTTDATASDHYNVNDDLSGSLSGTWTDSGSDSSDYHDVYTVTPSSTTDTYSSDAEGTENYDLNATGTYNGDSVTLTDDGSESVDYHDTGSLDADGNISDTPSQDDTAHETTQLTVSAGPTLYKVDSDETLGFHDHDGTQTTTDKGSDSSEYRDSGQLPSGPGSYSFDWNNSDTYDNSDTVMNGSESSDFSGSSTLNDTTTVSGVDDGNGPGDDETVTTLNHDYYNNQSFADGSYDNQSWGDFTDSDTGDDPSSFNTSGDGNYTVDETPSGGTSYYSPPDTTTTGTMPDGLPLAGDEDDTEQNAANPPFPGPAGFVQGMQATDSAMAAAVVQNVQTARPVHVLGQTSSSAVHTHSAQTSLQPSQSAPTQHLLAQAAAQPAQASEGLPSWLYRNYYEGTMFQQYLVYVNPFSSVETSGTHPNDVNLHYGNQIASGVAAGAISLAGGAYAAASLWGAGASGGGEAGALLTGVAATRYGQLYQQVSAAAAELQQYMGRLDQLSASEYERYQALYFNYLLLWNQLYGRN